MSHGWLPRNSPGLRRFVEGLSWNLAGHVIVRAAVLVAGLGIARTLGVDAFADFTFFLFSINLLAALSDMGISYAMIKYGVMARLGAEGPRGIDRLAAALHLGLAGFGVSFLAMILLTRVAAWPQWQIAALGVAGIAAVWQVTFASVLISMRRMRDIFVGNAIFAIVLIAGVAAGGWSASPMPPMLAYPAATLLQCLYQAKLVNRLLQVSGVVWLRPRLGGIKRAMGLIGFMAPISLIASILPWAIATIQLSEETGKVTLAVFGAATMLLGLTMTVPGRIAQLFFVDQIEQRLAEHAMMRSVRADLKAAGFSILVALAVISLLLLGGEILLEQYGPVIARHSWAIYALAAVAVIVCPYQIIGNRLVAAGWQALWLPITIVQAALLLGVVWTAPTGAVWGPALGYWISYAGATLVALPLYVFAIKRART